MVLKKVIFLSDECTNNREHEREKRNIRNDYGIVKTANIANIKRVGERRVVDRSINSNAQATAEKQEKKKTTHTNIEYLRCINKKKAKQRTKDGTKM